MTIRIAYQQLMAADPNNKWMLSFNKLLRANLDLVKPEDVIIEFQTLKRGPSHFEVFWNSYTSFLGQREILEGVIQAERDGFDAVMICCFFDPILKQARQAVDIPVVGAGEAALLAAQMMGSKMGIVTIAPQAVAEVEENLLRYGFEKRVAGVAPLKGTASEQMEAVYRAQSEIKDFASAALELITQGAEVLLPGCMVMSPVLRLAPGCPDYPQGLQQVDGVPVMDVVAVQLLMTYTLAKLRQAESPWISRKGLYARPTAKALKNIEKVLPYKGPGIFRS